MTQEIRVYTGLPAVPDGGVPNFGPEHPNFRPIERRRSKPSPADAEARLRLHTSAMNRALHFGYGIGDVADIQIPFPRAEHYQHFPFEHADWEKYGVMESERSRVEFMLDRYQERSFPLAFDRVVHGALESKDVLRAWKRATPQVAAIAQHTFGDIRDRMLAARKPDTVAVSLRGAEGYPNAFQSDPVHYTTAAALRDNEKTLWARALDEIAADLQRGNFRNVSTFLDLYGRVKDPVAPLTSRIPSQVRIFNQLFREAQVQLAKRGIADISDERGKTLIVQLALESSFLSLPSAKDIFYVRSNANDGAEHQELPYVYVKLKDLPRGEFTNPKAVMPRLVDLLNDAEKYDGRFVVTPLAVSHFQAPGAEEPTMFLVDGNNRATAIMVMQYIHEMQPTYANRLDMQVIRAFMQKHHLHPGWERELVLTLDLGPYTDEKGPHEGFSQQVFDRVSASRKKLAKGARGKVAALLVQETDFHNVQVDRALQIRPKVPLLQPMHQAIYNGDYGFAMAVPPKQQTHGRAMGNFILIETEQERAWPFGSRRHRIKEVPLAA